MEIRENISLSKYTTLKVGGPARFFCEAESEDEILGAVRFTQEKNLPFFVLGGGSNILVNDKGFDGLVIKIHDTSYKIHDTFIECGAGCQLSVIVNESAKAGLTGIEWAAGIPGTVGGAVRGNAGAFGSRMAEAVGSVKVIDINKINTKSREELRIENYGLSDCKFAYRGSVFKQSPNLIILSTTLELKKGNRSEGEKKIKEIIEKRKAAQPSEFPSSGSFFKNPTTKDKELLEEYKRDTGSETRGGVIPAGYLIERAGMRGKKIGGAMVSDIHANFLVNAGNAKAEDFVILAAVIKTRVRNRLGIQLKEEVEYVGF